MLVANCHICKEEFHWVVNVWGIGNLIVTEFQQLKITMEHTFVAEMSEVFNYIIIKPCLIYWEIIFKLFKLKINFICAKSMSNEFISSI